MLVKDYAPKAFVEPDNPRNPLDVTQPECMSPGDYIVCRFHPESIMFVIGTNYYKGEPEDPLDDSTVYVKGHCELCHPLNGSRLIGLWEHDGAC